LFLILPPATDLACDRVSRYGSSFAAGVCIALRATPDEGVRSYTRTAVTTRFPELLP